jgi:hypothetical protein
MCAYVPNRRSWLRERFLGVRASSSGLIVSFWDNVIYSQGTRSMDSAYRTHVSLDCLSCYLKPRRADKDIIDWKWWRTEAASDWKRVYDTHKLWFRTSSKYYRQVKSQRVRNEIHPCSTRSTVVQVHSPPRTRSDWAWRSSFSTGFHRTLLDWVSTFSTLLQQPTSMILSLGLNRYTIMRHSSRSWINIISWLNVKR